MKIRNWFFDVNVFKSKVVGSKIISVGNLTLGGSGKTPTVLHIAKFIQKNGFKSGILSRGYGRKSNGFLLVSNGNEIFADVDISGDEIYLTAKELRIPTAVSEKRVKGVIKLLELFNLDVVILDDAFQHRWLHRDLDIVMIDQRFLGKIGQIEQTSFPAGEMRESFSSIERADVIIINQKFSDKKEIPDKINKFLKGKTVIRGKYEAKGIYDVKTHQFFNNKEFQGQRSLVVCGVARPYSFLHALELNNIDFTNKLIFRDHKRYTIKEVQTIRKKFYNTNAYSVLTTQKDAVKLAQFTRELDDIDIYYLKIDLKLENQEKLNEIILNTINNKLNIKLKDGVK
jgi:tetraacyldisaccharide 4'-kinase